MKAAPDPSAYKHQSGDVIDTMTLAVCQAQFITAEQIAQATYEQESKENGIEKTTKDQDVRYKTKESNSEKGLTESKENGIEKTTKDQDVKYKKRSLTAGQ